MSWVHGLQLEVRTIGCVIYLEKNCFPSRTFLSFILVFGQMSRLVLIKYHAHLFTNQMWLDYEINKYVEYEDCNTHYIQ